MNDTIFPVGTSILGDSAFHRVGPTSQKILTPLTPKKLRLAYVCVCMSLSLSQEYPQRTHDSNAIAKHQAIIEIRQAAEWSVRDLRGAYPRLKTPLTSEPEAR